MVGICRGAQQLVLIGDQCQLPPTVTSRKAVLEGLDSPLYNRLISTNRVQPYLLDTQYRMHPAISEFPTDLFYSGKLQDGISARDRPSPKGFPWPKPNFPVAFVPVQGYESGSSSKSNMAEVRAVGQVVMGLLSARDLRPEEVGVVTPYADQVREIRRLLRNQAGGGIPPEVSSVDSFLTLTLTLTLTLMGGLLGRRLPGERERGYCLQCREGESRGTRWLSSRLAPCKCGIHEA